MSVRITLSEEDYNHLISEKILGKRGKQLRDVIISSAKFTDGRATTLRKVARERTIKTQESIRAAVATLRNDNKTITIYSVSKVCGSSWQTVKKYKEILNEGEQLNLLENNE